MLEEPDFHEIVDFELSENGLFNPFTVPNFAEFISQMSNEEVDKFLRVLKNDYGPVAQFLKYQARLYFLPLAEDAADIEMANLGVDRFDY